MIGHIRSKLPRAPCIVDLQDVAHGTLISGCLRSIIVFQGALRRVSPDWLKCSVLGHCVKFQASFRVVYGPAQTFWLVGVSFLVVIPFERRVERCKNRVVLMFWW